MADTYFLDSVEGNDLRDGLSVKSAWRSLEKANQHVYQPGDRLLLRSGRIWSGSLIFKGSGTKESPIVVSSYGEGERPVINSDGKTDYDAVERFSTSCAIRLFNQEHWRIENLEITNYNATEEEGLSLTDWEGRNITRYAEAELPGKVSGGNMRKAGILVQAIGEINGSVLTGFVFSNLKIHGINGDLSSKDNGGVFFKAYNDGLGHTIRFDDVLFENNEIHDVDRTGVSNQSDFDDRDLNKSFNWVPNRNWVFRNNVFRRTGANALIIRVADAPLMEHNLFEYCAIKESGNAAFNFNTDGAVWQFNEFCFTKANFDDEDAGGVDSDFRSKNTLIQYNHLHDNDFGLLVTGGPGRFNEGTILKHNLIVNDGTVVRKGDDGKFVLRVSGSATNTRFFRNTIIVGKDRLDTKIILHKRWKTMPENTVYEENTIVNLGRSSLIEVGDSTGNHFIGNDYFGQAVEEPISDD